MGFRLYGYLVKGPGPVLPALEASFGRAIKEETKVSFEKATLNKHDPDHLDVFHTEKGFLILCDVKAVNEKTAARLSEGTESLTFQLSETSMTFMFEKYKDGQLVWEDGALFEGKLTRMGRTLPIDENTDVVFDTFPELTREFTGVGFHGIELSEQVTRYHLGHAVAQSQPAGKPVESIPQLGNLHQEAELLYMSFWGRMYESEKKKPARPRKEGEKTVYSFEAFLREMGASQEQIRRYGEYVLTDEFREATRQKQQAFRRKTLKRSSVMVASVWLGLTVVYFIAGLVVSAFTGTSVWSLSFLGWVAAAAFMTCALLLLRAWLRGKKEAVIIRIFDDEGGKQ